MGQSANDLISSWKLARYQEIKKLYNGGATAKQLIDRFGRENVQTALRGVTISEGVPMDTDEQLLPAVRQFAIDDLPKREFYFYDNQVNDVAKTPLSANRCIKVTFEYSDKEKEKTLDEMLDIRYHRK